MHGNPPKGWLGWRPLVRDLVIRHMIVVWPFSSGSKQRAAVFRQPVVTLATDVVQQVTGIASVDEYVGRDVSCHLNAWMMGRETGTDVYDGATESSAEVPEVPVSGSLEHDRRDLPCPFLEVSWIGEPTPGNDSFALVIRPRGQFEDIIVSEAENDGAKSKILDEIELGVD